MLKTPDKPQQSTRVLDHVTYLLTGAAVCAIVTGKLNLPAALLLTTVFCLVWGQTHLAAEIVRAIRRRLAKFLEPPDDPPEEPPDSS